MTAFDYTAREKKGTCESIDANDIQGQFTHAGAT